MAIWRLVTHHQSCLKQEALSRYWNEEFIALGWGPIGDLNALRPINRTQIETAIRQIPDYATAASARSGGWCLWGLYHEMQVGDLVILSLGRGPEKEVVEVAGDYYWQPEPVFVGSCHGDYQHIRPVRRCCCKDGRSLWEQHAGKPALGWFIRRALIRLL